MQLPHPLSREVVLIGGGHTHALVLRKWGMTPVAGARLTVINPTPSATYTGMLPGFVAGHYRRDELDINLMRLARFAGARLIRDVVTAIDPEAQRITLAGRQDIPYDIASIDIGITSQTPEIEGFSEFGLSAKPLGPYANAWTEFLSRGGGPVAVIGAGLGGCELALAMSHALAGGQDVTLIDAGELAADLPKTARLALREHLTLAGVALREHCTVARISEQQIELGDGTTLPAQLTVTATGARPFDWLEETGLALTDGFVTVDRNLRSTSHASVFASGDCAHLVHAPRPKAGVFAVRAAPVLYHNLRAELTGGKPKPFHPQRDYLKLVSLGGKTALALRSGRQAQGAWVWRWKDRIDRRFMKKLSNLPAMRPNLPPQRVRTDATPEQVLCAGCGSKVGPVALSAATATLPAFRDDVDTTIGDDAAVLRVGDARQVLTTDHLRDFTGDPARLARIAALHALGDIWAMGATPQAALSSIVLPPLDDRLQRQWLDEIMSAAAETLQSEGVQIVGGHTTQGAELTIGFSLTGLLDRDPITLAGGQPGDALILTRPIGTGVLLAADMALTARGEDVAAALDEMARSQSDAARILCIAHAMTDVTGFGLAGHAAAIARASGTGLELHLDAIPIYAGAEPLAQSGIRSTLFDANRAAHSNVMVPESARGNLLFDPQTAGGLLAAVPSDAADDLLRQLLEKDHAAAVIGRLTEAHEGLRAE